MVYYSNYNRTLGNDLLSFHLNKIRIRIVGKAGGAARAACQPFSLVAGIYIDIICRSQNELANNVLIVHVVTTAVVLLSIK